MYSSKFFKNHFYRERTRQSDFPDFEFTSAELYPRRRRTELYYRSSIPEEYQSRSFEHPTVLDKHKSRIDHDEHDDHKAVKIIPPKNSDMRIARDSYFS